jgi:hypothetical protein
MNEFVELEGTDLKELIRQANMAGEQGAYKLRVAIDGGLKIKWNEYSWSPPMGAVVTTGEGDTARQTLMTLINWHMANAIDTGDSFPEWALNRGRMDALVALTQTVLGLDYAAANTWLMAMCVSWAAGEWRR